MTLHTLLRHLRYPRSVEILRHCVLSGGSERRALSRYQSEEIKILNISFLQVARTLANLFLFLRTIYEQFCKFISKIITKKDLFIKVASGSINILYEYNLYIY